MMLRYSIQHHYRDYTVREPGFVLYSILFSRQYCTFTPDVHDTHI